MTDLAVIIVTWNIRDLIEEALQSLYDDLEASDLTYEVYVVDSASSDGTPDLVAEKFPQVKLIVSETNVGFAGGNNLALREIGFGNQGADTELPRAVYLLNPDTITRPGATRALYNTLNAESALGVVGARLSYGDGNFQHSAFRFPGLRQLWVELFPTPGRLIDSAFNGRYDRALYNENDPFEIDFPLGATMMLKREVVQATGMFDEAFFMYCEEVDWAWRIHDAGWEIKCVPQARVVHLVGQSTSQVKARSVLNLWTSRLLLFRKHYPGWKLAIAQWMIAYGMRLREREVYYDQSLTDAQRRELANVYQQIGQMTLE